MVTDKQVRRLFALGKVEMNLETAAAKAGMDAKTARKYRRLGRVPSELTPGPGWRTREDAFQEVWAEVQSLLEVNPGLEAKTIFEYLQRRYAGRFAEGVVGVDGSGEFALRIDGKGHREAVGLSKLLSELAEGVGIVDGGLGREDLIAVIVAELL